MNCPNCGHPINGIVIDPTSFKVANNAGCAAGALTTYYYSHAGAAGTLPIIQFDGSTAGQPSSVWSTFPKAKSG